MKQLLDRIRQDGRVIGHEILKVDSFLNHQLDPLLLQAIGREFAARFAGLGVTKILTIEASGIAVALMAGLEMGVPVLFAKKRRARTHADAVFAAPVISYTRGETVEVYVSQRFLSPEDTVLILDDFLAMGEATSGLISLVRQAGARLAGAGIVVEKGFQEGGRRLRAQGVNLQSLVVIEALGPEGIQFAEPPGGGKQ
ncbi:MAG TPA: xanthine phosphoribosyltransferase [Symbiobacteriaceae bacterium]|nr:xanthine phosphoribosyltransferase [Symbiobacteriaceae bacterium]